MRKTVNKPGMETMIFDKEKMKMNNCGSKRMNVLILLIGIFFICPADELHGQVLFTPEELKMANIADTVDYLQDEEKKVIMFINLARMDGQKFYKSFILDYVKRRNAFNSTYLSPENNYLISLKTDLQRIKNIRVLFPYKALCLSASFHAKDMGRVGGLGHDSSDGTECFKRIRRFFPELEFGEENCSYGFGSAEDIVCQLLIDKDVPSLGHRESILNPSLRIIGVGISTHKSYGYNCVIDYAD